MRSLKHQESKDSAGVLSEKSTPKWINPVDSNKNKCAKSSFKETREVIFEK
jgi:hypothetical protein